jgi:diguanylate cyclase (GGDEF)-like protein
MSKNRILVVEDDSDSSNMLRIYFTSQGFDVSVAPRGGVALEMCRKSPPDLVLLDILLPDILGTEVAYELRKAFGTQDIPIIFLTQKDERSDKISGLELGVNDYITKPFDIEELKLRVTNTIRNQSRATLKNPITGLPSGHLIEEQLNKFLRSHNWTYLQIGIEHFAPYNDVYGYVAGDEVIRLTASLVTEIIAEEGTPDDFIGHARGDIFIVITTATDVASLIEKLRGRFTEKILVHYSFADREQKGINRPDGAFVPLMYLSIGVVSAHTRAFTNGYEILDAGTESRRMDKYLSQLASDATFGNVVQFRQWLAELVSWAILEIKVDNVLPFVKYYGEGWRRKTRELLVEALVSVCKGLGHRQTRLAHLSEDNFIIIIDSDKIAPVEKELHQTFNERVMATFPTEDIKGRMVYPSPDQPLPFPPPSLLIHCFTAHDGQYPSADQLFEAIIKHNAARSTPDTRMYVSGEEYDPETQTLRKIDWSMFRDKLDAHFNESELRELCDEIEVDYENLKGSTKRDKASELISFCRRHGKLSELVERCHALRPRVTWQVGELEPHQVAVKE